MRIIIFFLIFFQIFINKSFSDTNISSGFTNPFCENKIDESFTKNIDDLNVKKIEIDTNNYRKWTVNGIRIITNGFRFTPDKYKIRFKSKILVTYENNIQCIFNARVRHSGDAKDHIRWKNNKIHQSLDVHLDNGHIKGVTKFKLYLPGTRGIVQDEILITEILRNFNYIAPRTFKVNVRIICSSSKDVLNEIKNGNFREDLYHRLNVFSIKIDPLYKRIEDIPLLVDYFIENICNTYNYKKFTIKDNNYLLNYNWPGNVRELRNLIERIAILSPGEDSEKIITIIKESLSKSADENFSVTDTLSIPLREARESFEKEYLISQIKKYGGNISKTAKFIGMERSALHRKLKLLGVKDLN